MAEDMASPSGDAPGNDRSEGLKNTVTLALIRANAFGFLVPIFILSLGIAFYGEALTVSVALGASLALFGILIVNRSNRATPATIARPAPEPILDTTAP